MKTYPTVLDEATTLARVCAGASLARFGDGEFGLAGCCGRAKRQGRDPALRERLRGILRDPPCLVGIPNLTPRSPKAAYWLRYHAVAPWLTDGVIYGSSFVTRPDSAPWIDTPAYWTMLESLWVGQDVTLVRGGAHGLLSEDLIGAGLVTVVEGPDRDAWSVYPRLLDAIGRPRRALLCLGPTATVLAADLAERGIQAIDLGHCAMFLRKRRRGEPLVVTDADRAA